jgi:cellulose synthase/poly-beta-1,6-N-acetylglucosamine synthase-like glycosyltransferase
LVVQIVSIITLVLTLSYIGLKLYLKRGWDKLKSFEAGNREYKTTVSVIIAARNEQDKIKNTIQDILAQNYPSQLLRLIVVDDHSTDRTSEIVLSFEDPRVKLIILNEKKPLNSYKKKAITEALKYSESELIISTDADCRMSSNWVKTIVALYESGDYKMVSSPVLYFEEKNIFEKMQSLEFLFLIGLGASGIGNGIPTTCNGANLAYQRDVFFELKGFQGIDNLASGDDELFMHKVASAYPEGIGFCKSMDAIVYTHAKANLNEFIQQRKRWASKTTSYKNKSIVFLGILIWIFNLNIIIAALAGFIDPVFWKIAAVSIFLKMLAELIFLIPLCRFAGRLKLLRYQPFLSIIHMFYLVYIGIAGNSGKYMWKGRLVR